MSPHAFAWIRSRVADRTPQGRRSGRPLAVEQVLVDELRSRIRQLPEAEAMSDSAANIEWLENARQIRELILQNHPRDFLNWDIMKKTMVYEPDIRELKHLQRLPDWNRWRNALVESSAGNPQPYSAFKSSSGNLIHHAYSFSLLIQRIKCTVDQIPQIVEFGGGYGSMCRLVYQLGFRGRYVIFDLPELSALQEYFLRSVGISKKISKAATFEDCIVLLNDLRELSKQLRNENGNYAFIATWSLSETSENLRDTILNIIGDARFFLIAYQNTFGEVNNVEYFSRFAVTNKGYQWSDFEIPHLPKNRYLIGSRLTINPDTA